MLAERDAEGNPFPEEVIFGNAIQMLAAGEDTTANSLAWAVHLLLDADEAVQALREQVDAVLGDTAMPDSPETVRALTQAEAISNESMRLKPVAPAILLETNEPVVLGDVALDAGTGVCLLTRLAALNPEHVEAPEEFRPARWTDPKTVKALQRQGVFTPFGSGPRLCPGRSLALLEMRMVLAMLYKNFDVVREGAAEDVAEVFGFTVAPEGLRVRLSHRSV